MPDTSRFFITTAISYPNGRPHIGHAYELIATDALARFARLDGRDVLFSTGIDSHGLKMVQTAREKGMPVEDLARENGDVFEEMARALNSSHDTFIRTSEERHHAASQALWSAMEAKGDIYKNTYSGWYSVRDEAYYDEAETVLAEDTKGEQTRLGPQGTPVEWVEEETYFFRLSAYEDKLLALYDSQPAFIAPKERRNEIVSFVKSGLRDLSISRTTFDWGVKVPGDEAHVMYVWVDALTNYLTVAGYPNAHERWPADLHVIGKDITRFHAVYWPAFLMSADLPLPKQVFGHGFVLNKGEKMGKSAGNALDPFDLVEEYGLDQVRYFLLREVAFGNDGSYSHESIVNHTNADLANDLGNLAQRSLSMVFKNCDGQIPTPNGFTPEDEAILEKAYGLLDICRSHMEDRAIHRAVAAVWDIVSETNRYFADAEPWALKKTDPDRMKTVLYVTAEIIRVVAILAQPYVPTSANLLLDRVAVPANKRSFEHACASEHLKDGTVIEKPEGVFPRYVEAADNAG